MTWRIVWNKAVLEQLAEIWLRAIDKDAISRAVTRLDRKFAENPAELGESRELNQRVTFEPPLVATFAVEPRLSLVTVVRLQTTSQK